MTITSSISKKPVAWIQSISFQKKTSGEGELKYKVQIENGNINQFQPNFSQHGVDSFSFGLTDQQTQFGMKIQTPSTQTPVIVDTTQNIYEGEVTIPSTFNSGNIFYISKPQGNSLGHKILKV
jgi:hypothetical protein